MPNIYEEVTTLIETGKYDEAYKIANDPKYANDFEMIAKKIKILRRRELLPDAYTIASAERFNDCDSIQIELIKTLIAMKNFKKAIKKAQEERFKDNEKAQELLIKAYLNSCHCHDAVALASEERFHDNVKIQYLLIVALEASHQLPKAYELVCEERFKDNKHFQRRKRRIEKKLQEQQLNHTKSSTNLKQVLYAIKEKSITELEIEALELSTFQKKLLMVVFYYQNMYPLNIIKSILKRLENEYQNNELAQNAIKQFQRILNQKNPFTNPFQFYSLLNQDFEQGKMSL